MRFTHKKCKVPKPVATPLPKGAISRVELLSSDPIEMKHLKSAISLLTHQCNEKRKKEKNSVHCVHKDKKCDTKIRPHISDVSLRARDPTVIEQQIRHAILLRDWETAAQLLQLFISTGVLVQTSFIARAFMVILMNHPLSDSELLYSFLREVTLYENDEDIKKYAILMRTLRKNILKPLTAADGDVRRRNIKLIELSNYTSIELNTPLFK